MKVLVELFQKLALIQRAERGSPPQRRNSFIRGSFLPSFFLCASSAKEKSGQTVTMRKMGFAFLHKAILCSTPAFLLTPLAQNENRFAALSQKSQATFCLAKENAVGLFRSLRRATADRGGSDKPLKRLEPNFQKDKVPRRQIKI